MTAARAPADERIVVCVEDVDSSAQLVDRALRRVPGVRVVMAGTGREARQRLAATSAALVLTDLNLPDVSGAEWVAELVVAVGGAGVPVVVVSADATAASREAALAAGATEYLTKPIDLHQLIAVVSELAFATPVAVAPASEGLPRELVERYLAEATTDLDQLRDALAAGDPVRVVALAHRLKGGSTVFGVSGAAAAFARVEQAASDGRLAAAGPLLDDAGAVLARFRTSLARF